MVKTVLTPRPATVFLGGLAIARRARFCKEVQRLCTAPRASQIKSGLLEATVYKGGIQKNTGFGRFSINERIALGAVLGSIRRVIGTTVSQAGRDAPGIPIISQPEQNAELRTTPF